MNLAVWTERSGVARVTAYRWFRAGVLPVPARAVSLTHQRGDNAAINLARYEEPISVVGPVGATRNGFRSARQHHARMGMSIVSAPGNRASNTARASASACARSSGGAMMALL